MTRSQVCSDEAVELGVVSLSQLQLWQARVPGNDACHTVGHTAFQQLYTLHSALTVLKLLTFWSADRGWYHIHSCDGVCLLLG